jgi:hypothetical protein
MRAVDTRVTRRGSVHARPMIARRPLIASSLWLSLGLAAGCHRAATAPADSRPAVATYDAFWQDFDRTYPYFTYKQVDWNAARGLRERAADAASDSALVWLMKDAVTPLRDMHVWFKRPDGTQVSSYTRTRAANWDNDAWRGSITSIGWHQGVSNWGWARHNGVGYLTIGAWNTAQVKIGEVEAALDSLRDTRALVLDVRANGGGNDALALQLAGRFTTQTREFGAVRYRNGAGHDDFGGWTGRTLGPRGSWQYTKPVYLLVGARCASSNETFIAAMRQLPNVTVLGDTTGGGSANPREMPIVVGGRDTGWRYSVSQWQERLATGALIEWQGIAPAEVLPWDLARVAAGRDPILELVFARAGAPLPP